MKYFKENPVKWSCVPKNMTSIKIKIIEQLLASLSRNGKKFVLDQACFVNVLKCQWSGTTPSAKVTTNDKLCVFGLLMAHEPNRYILE